MSSILFIKRVFCNKIFWLSVMAALLLLMCSNVHKDLFTGETYTFASLFYDDAAKEALQSGQISIKGILMGYDTSYLWMFCPIIVSIPCVMTKKTERFFMFRAGKNKYLLSKYFVNLFAGGVIMLGAYLLYALLGMALVKENIWDIYITKKMLSVFCWGIYSAVPGVLLSEFVNNKYLILCIPFVLNYFMYSFIANIVPYKIMEHISPSAYQILFLNENKMIVSGVAILLVLIVVCAFVKKLIMERRCDCGQ